MRTADINSKGMRRRSQLPPRCWCPAFVVRLNAKVKLKCTHSPFFCCCLRRVILFYCIFFSLFETLHAMLRRCARRRRVSNDWTRALTLKSFYLFSELWWHKRNLSGFICIHMYVHINEIFVRGGDTSNSSDYYRARIILFLINHFCFRWKDICNVLIEMYY